MLQTAGYRSQQRALDLAAFGTSHFSLGQVLQTAGYRSYQALDLATLEASHFSLVSGQVATAQTCEMCYRATSKRYKSRDNGEGVRVYG